MEVLVALVARNREASHRYVIRVQVQIVIVLQSAPAVKQLVTRTIAIPVTIIAGRIVEARLPRTRPARHIRAAAWAVTAI